MRYYLVSRVFVSRRAGSILDTDPLLRARQGQDPIAQGMPLGQLVVPTGVVDVDEVLVIHGHGPHLVVGGGKHLDHVVPGLAVLLVSQELLPLGLQVGHGGVQKSQTALVQAVVGEIIPLKGLGVDLVHGGGGVGHGAHLVGVKFLPPVQRGGDVHRHEDLTEELSVVAPRYRQAVAEVDIHGAEDEFPVFIVVAVGFCPAVHGVAGASDGAVQVHDCVAFNFQHDLSPIRVFFQFSLVRV